MKIHEIFLLESAIGKIMQQRLFLAEANKAGKVTLHIEQCFCIIPQVLACFN